MKKLLILLFVLLVSVAAKDAPSWYYELRVYRLADANDGARAEAYLEKALLPFLHRNGIKNVGVFKPMKEDTVNTNRIYVLIPYSSFSQFEKTTTALQADAKTIADGSDYTNSAHTDPPYVRIETTLMRAFKFMPAPAVPNLKSSRQERVYELRSYEGATEKLYQSKVHMFNEGGEVKLFNRLNFNAVFYGEVLSGSRMPNLVYMTSFENRADRDEHWKAFSASPEWTTLKVLPQYQNTVSRNETIFLTAAPYSDF